MFGFIGDILERAVFLPLEVWINKPSYKELESQLELANNSLSQEISVRHKLNKEKWQLTNDLLSTQRCYDNVVSVLESTTAIANDRQKEIERMSEQLMKMGKSLADIEYEVIYREGERDKAKDIAGRYWKQIEELRAENAGLKSGQAYVIHGSAINKLVAEANARRFKAEEESHEPRALIVRLRSMLEKWLKFYGGEKNGDEQMIIDTNVLLFHTKKD